MGLRIVTIKLDDELVSLLDEIAKAFGYQYRSDVIREAIKEWLQKRGINVVMYARPKFNSRASIIEVPVD
jgi:metal-responsive CopG/Arc/MetJ family transcriptional regulator